MGPAAILLIAIFVPSPLSAKEDPPRILVVDDFDRPSLYNHLKGSFGVVAAGGKAKFDFAPPEVPYLVNQWALDVSYKTAPNPGYAFLWMKLGAPLGASDVTTYLDLSAYQYLSLQYRILKPKKKDGPGNDDFKIEIHQDADGDGRFIFEKDKSSAAALSQAAVKGPENPDWRKAIVPLNRFREITDWSKILEIVFVFERDRTGAARTVRFGDLSFLRPEGRLRTADLEKSGFEFLNPIRIFKDGKKFSGGIVMPPVPNRFEIRHKPGPDFYLLEKLVLEAKLDGESWTAVAEAAVVDPKKTVILWEPATFKPWKNVSLRLSGRDLYGRIFLLSGPLDGNAIQPMSDEQFLDLVERRVFSYFAEKQDVRNGLFLDTSGGGDASTAVTGFGLTALAIGAERGWIGKREARSRALQALRTLLEKAEAKEGLYYHFLNPDTVQRAGVSEISTVDTAILLAGAVTAGEYFGGKVKKKADALYGRANWPFFLDQDPQSEHYLHFHHGWTPEDELSDYFWDFYTDETLLLTLLAIGSPSYPVSPEVFYRFVRRKEAYGLGEPFIYTWHGGLFSYQYAHAWFSLRGLEDREQIDWWENSKRATLANREYIIDHAGESKTYGADAWGITSMRIPERYVMHYGTLPNGQDQAIHDGTISPSGPGGSIVFTPYLSLRMLKRLYLEHPQIWGPFGFRDSINEDTGWVSPLYYGLGEGILLLAIENFRTGFVWQHFMKNPGVQKALERAQFTARSVSERSRARINLKTFEKQLSAKGPDGLLWYRHLENILARDLEVRTLKRIYKAVRKMRPVYEAQGGSVEAAKALAKIQMKILESLSENDLEAGRKYLRAGSRHARGALRHYEEALGAVPSERQRAELLMDKISVLEHIQAKDELEHADREFAETLQRGIQNKLFDLYGALLLAGKMGDVPARHLRRMLSEKLDPWGWRTLLSYLEREAEKSFQAGDYARAAAFFEERSEALARSGAQAAAIHQYLEKCAEGFLGKEEFGEAERFYRMIFESRDFSDAAKKEKIMLRLAVLIEKKGNSAQAVKIYRRFVKEFPDSESRAQALSRLAILESGFGNRSRAMKWFEEITARYPATAYAEEALYFLGMMYYRAERYAEAIRAWERLRQGFPQSERIQAVEANLENALRKQPSGKSSNAQV